MRMRRKPWARPELNACDFYIQSPEKKISIWAQTFRKPQPLHLELGCGKGVFTAEISSAYPEINYLAIDANCDVLGCAKRNADSVFKQKSMPVDNLLLTSYNVEKIDEIISETDAVERIYINFCNPWIQRLKQKKRRLTHPRFLEKYKKFMKPNSCIYFKTDNDQLYCDSIDYFEASGFNIIYKTEDLYKTENIFPESKITTEHEQKFLEQNLKIKFLTAQLL